MQFVQSVNRHNSSANGYHPAGGMYLPGMAGPTRINYTVRRTKDRAEDNDDACCPMKPVLTDCANIKESSTKEEPTTPAKESRAIVTYQARPGGPWRCFKVHKHNRKNNTAATVLQRVIRGHCARTKAHILKLQRQLSRINRQTRSELREIEESKQQAMLKMRQKMIKRETQTLKDHMACAETATQGAELIYHLRNENKKLRAKNDKIARAIAELNVQNDRLDKAATMTESNESLLSKHYEQIKATNKALMTVTPKYEQRLKEMKQAMDVRRQYCYTEHKMKLLYVRLVGSLVDMLEDKGADKDLVDSVVAMCVELKDTLPDEFKDIEEEEAIDEIDCEEESDSNDYDEYDIAVFDESSKSLNIL